MVALIIVDSNVWIFLNIDSYPEHSASVEKISQLRKEGLVTNIITVSETFHKLSLLLNRKEACLRAMKILESNDVTYVPVDVSTTTEAIRLAGKRQLRINDAVIAVQSMMLKCPVLTDNVKDFKKIRGLEVIGLR